MTICDRLFNIMDSQGKRAADLCKVLHIGTSITTGWKNRGTDPPAKYIMQISEFLEISPEFLLTGSDPANPENEMENEILRMFRRLPDYNKEFVYDSIKAAYEKEIARQKEAEDVSA